MRIYVKCGTAGTFSIFKLYMKLWFTQAGMPRKSRIDAPGALHHIIARGIDRGLIFRDDVDRNRSLERLQRTYQLKSLGLDVDKVAERVAALLSLPVEAVWAVGKHRKTVAARSLLCYWSVRQLGLSMSSLALRLGISSTSVSQSVVIGELLAKKRNYKLVE